MIRATVALLFLCASFEVAAQHTLSAQEVLQRAKVSYDLTRRLSCNVEVEVDGLVDYTLKLAWTRDGDRYRLDTGGAVDDKGEHIDMLIPTTVCILDGQDHLTYTEANYGSGTQREARIHSGPGGARRMNQQWLAGLGLDGVLYGDNEDVFTILLRQTNTGAIAVATETLEGRECIHITANVPEGEYELWLDPAVGYRPRKSIVRKSGDNPYMGKPISQSSEWASLQATISNLDIKDVLGGTLAVSGLLQVTGDPSPLSSAIQAPEGDSYAFSRNNCKFGAILSAKDLTFSLPEDTQVTRRTE